MALYYSKKNNQQKLQNKLLALIMFYGYNGFR